MPLIVVSRAAVDINDKMVFESVKTRMFKQAKELQGVKKVRFAKQAGFEYHDGTITGTWFFEVR